MFILNSVVVNQLFLSKCPVEDLNPDEYFLIDKVVGLQIEHKWNILLKPDVNVLLSPDGS